MEGILAWLICGTIALGLSGFRLAQKVSEGMTTPPAAAGDKPH